VINKVRCGNTVFEVDTEGSASMGKALRMTGEVTENARETMRY